MENLVDVPEQGVQRRGGVAPVVLDPTPPEWIELPGDVLQRQLCFAPTSQERVKFRDQLLSFQRHRPFGSLPYLVDEKATSAREQDL